ncbi:hypothetical protein RchiOBHm_Chr7g0197381 [Rosa chinensis]|uniref:Uncharacterized protein n=1 Tax=Rosa chinensis TaxID=74649 RepID=A0A2P6P6U5_ROSCH|nr:hypothetical protein RchiOBHm_Chr7g0197381 [Rosa chinensis]
MDNASASSKFSGFMFLCLVFCRNQFPLRSIRSVSNGSVKDFLPHSDPSQGDITSLRSV